MNPVRSNSLTVRVEVGIHTTCLAALYKLDSLHDLVREGDLLEPYFLSQLPYLDFILRASIRVHQDYGNAIESFLLFQSLKISLHLGLIQWLHPHVFLLVNPCNQLTAALLKRGLKWPHSLAHLHNFLIYWLWPLFQQD
jgi:hypothetical protein